VTNDACAIVYCGTNGACNDGLCTCSAGYHGPECEHYDACASVYCGTNGVCNGGLCACSAGYHGPECEHYDVCFGINCGHGGCNEGMCVCQPGYSGEFCQVDDMCLAIQCNHGDCIRGMCECVQGFTGTACEVDMSNPCFGVDCGHGTCTDGGACICNDGWVGSACAEASPYCDWNINPCLHNGVCQSIGQAAYICSGCDQGWVGSICDEGMPYCDWHVNPCQHGGACESHGMHAYNCTSCDEGWGGQSCDQPIPFCDWHASPCGNGECVSQGQNDFACIGCLGRWSGYTCDVSPPPDWYFGTFGESCDEVCTAAGKGCTDGDWGVNSEASMREALDAAGRPASGAACLEASQTTCEPQAPCLESRVLCNAACLQISSDGHTCMLWPNKPPADLAPDRWQQDQGYYLCPYVGPGGSYRYQFPGAETSCSSRTMQGRYDFLRLCWCT
jgi:hypothetical protein